jgi:hypothetical protein
VKVRKKQGFREIRFFEIRKAILEKIASGQIGREIGLKREERVKKALEELKEEGLIRDFLPAGSLSFADIIKGIDFTVITIGKTRYCVHYLDTTGYHWVKKHQEKRRDRIVIPIEVDEPIPLIKEKIINLIREEH